MDNNVLIIIPAYNEEEAIATTVRSINKKVNVDIVIVNDGSLDRTKEIITLLAQEFSNLSTINLPVNSGIGVAVQTGFLFAKEHLYDYAIQFDGDGQHSADSINDLIEHAKSNRLDLCVGSRYLNMNDNNFKSTPLRRVGIMFFSKLISMLTGTCVKDTTSGFRIYGKKVINAFSKHYPDDYPEPEALYWCVRNKLKVDEIPVKMLERQGGVSSIQHIKSVYYMLKVTIAIFIDRIRKVEI